jgi:DNA-binding transcriptional LysR family regulator
MKSLDIDAVNAFALVASLGSFTRTAEATGSTQSGVSLKLKRLESLLGRRLVERTPRLVRLTRDGEAFLPHARNLLAANQRAVEMAPAPARRFRLGVSDHAAGDALPSLLGRLKDASPGLAMEVRVGLSQDLLASYEEGDFDAVIVRQERSNRGGELLTDDPYGWFASPSFKWEMGAPLALASLSPTCGVRAIAVRALDKAGIPWREVFVGGGVAALAAAIDAGLGAAVLARNVAPSGGIDIGGKYGLPPLPRSRVVLHARASDPETSEVLELVAALFRRK